MRVDWSLEETVWRAAGLAYRACVERRQSAQQAERRILADFVIGAHAVQRQATLLTWDNRIYQTYFPGLVTATP